MASAWGSSWGTAWGSSWGTAVAPGPIVDPKFTRSVRHGTHRIGSSPDRDNAERIANVIVASPRRIGRTLQ